MSESATETRHPAAFSYRTYKAGGVLLMISGVLGSIAGLALLFGSSLFGNTLNALGVTSLTAAIGVVVLVFSVIEFAGGYLGYGGHSWYGSMIGGILGMVTIVTLPLNLIGTMLIALGEGQFEDSPVAVATASDEYAEGRPGVSSGTPSSTDD